MLTSKRARTGTNVSKTGTDKKNTKKGAATKRGKANGQSAKSQVTKGAKARGTKPRTDNSAATNSAATKSAKNGKARNRKGALDLNVKTGQAQSAKSAADRSAKNGQRALGKVKSKTVSTKLALAKRAKADTVIDENVPKSKASPSRSKAPGKGKAEKPTRVSKAKEMEKPPGSSRRPVTRGRADVSSERPTELEDDQTWADKPPAAKVRKPKKQKAELSERDDLAPISASDSSADAEHSNGAPKDASSSPLQVGSDSPDFELSDQHGNVVSSDSLKGQAYVLYFYPKDNTPGCTTEACAFRDHHVDFESAGTKVIGVSPDSSESHNKFAEKFELDFTLLADPERVLADKYGVWGKKNLYGKEHMGIVRSTFLVDKDGTIRGAWRGVKVPGHVETVLEEAEALSAQ